MSRPLIEFIQSQRLDWEGSEAVLGRTGAQVKLLSRDEQSGARTLLVRYPAGYRGRLGTNPPGDEEIFVLEGSLQIGGSAYDQHVYGYLPQGREDTLESVRGATVLTFISDPQAAGGVLESIDALDTTAMAWDRSNMDPNVDHLNTARKNLRFDPRGSCRTYLLAGLPQGMPPSAEARMEQHPHVEEFFVIYGDMSCSVGIMRAGAYCWRPPGVWHGLDCTRSGFLIFFRSPGVNKNVNKWSETAHPVVWNPQHRPQLPAVLESSFLDPQANPIEY